nr:uncharacterized protein LOC103455763 isoform X1 [Malus domestica]XP_028951104.1 uncharacterized protein LOC103455763 isoform X1 [Malus domestica]
MTLLNKVIKCFGSQFLMLGQLDSRYLAIFYGKTCSTPCGLNSSVRRAIYERLDLFWPDRLKRWFPKSSKFRNQQLRSELVALKIEDPQQQVGRMLSCPFFQHYLINLTEDGMKKRKRSTAKYISTESIALLLSMAIPISLTSSNSTCSTLGLFEIVLVDLYLDGLVRVEFRAEAVIMQRWNFTCRVKS